MAVFTGDKEVYRKGIRSRQTDYLGNTGQRRPQKSRGPPRPLDEDRCAYYKEKEHLVRDCPQKRDKFQTAQGFSPKRWWLGESGLRPLPKPGAILSVEGTTTVFIIDTRAEISVLKEPLEKLKDNNKNNNKNNNKKPKQEQNKTKQNKNRSNHGYWSETILLDHW